MTPIVHIVYAHPSKKSITHEIKEGYIQGLNENNIQYTITDLYESNFNPDITEEEYLRENNNIPSPISEDILIEQEKINNANINLHIPIIVEGCSCKISGIFRKSIHLRIQIRT